MFCCNIYNFFSGKYDTWPQDFIFYSLLCLHLSKAMVCAHILDSKYMYTLHIIYYTQEHIRIWELSVAQWQEKLSHDMSANKSQSIVLMTGQNRQPAYGGTGMLQCSVVVNHSLYLSAQCAFTFAIICVLPSITKIEIINCVFSCFLFTIYTIAHCTNHFKSGFLFGMISGGILSFWKYTYTNVKI